ncbi:tannase and feruloyl esterase [Tothia fuscella]|uniref:Carboxylic ester hydrolase n=1 Tax=Tothia fuscella TaxID=1048955 RepID=A0A9P4NU17_9PEZI|nr:tannase and feruloyl esterase [Tothia fuscella]
MIYHLLFLLLCLPSLGSPVAAASFRDLCNSFQPSTPNSTVELVEFIPRNTSVDLNYRDVTCGGPGKSAPVGQDLCRIALNIKTSNRSKIHLEAWLPEDWNGRFLATGNGGISGCIDYASLAYTTEHGFAAVGSNNGHNGTTGKAFYRNLDVVADFAGRALHTSVTIGKQITNTFYGKPHQKSYFLGCSQGGRQGVGSAEKYPTDFDGIVAGAPALDFNNLISWRASFYPVTGLANSTGFIKNTTWSDMIHDEVLKQCDTIDGVKDGIIEYPDLCKFRSETLQCKNGRTEDCLDSLQVQVVRKVLSPLAYENGTIIYSAMNPGSEGRAIDRLYAGKSFSDSQDWFRYVIYDDPDWDPSGFTTKDAAASELANPFDIRTFPSDLTTFNSTQSKLLVYHGGQDQQITSLNTERWYEHLKHGMNATATELDSFTRFFRISGMGHCSGGPGANMVGQSNQKGVPYEPQSNVLAAIVDWVENGNAPQTIEGTKFVNDNATEGIHFKRKHCRYPLRNTYKPYSSAAGFISVDSKERQVSSVEDWKCV